MSIASDSRFANGGWRGRSPRAGPSCVRASRPARSSVHSASRCWRGSCPNGKQRRSTASARSPAAPMILAAARGSAGWRFWTVTVPERGAGSSVHSSMSRFQWVRSRCWEPSSCMMSASAMIRRSATRPPHSCASRWRGRNAPSPAIPSSTCCWRARGWWRRGRTPRPAGRTPKPPRLHSPGVPTCNWIVWRWRRSPDELMKPSSSSRRASAVTTIRTSNAVRAAHCWWARCTMRTPTSSAPTPLQPKHGCARPVSASQMIPSSRPRRISSCRK